MLTLGFRMAFIHANIGADTIYLLQGRIKLLPF